MTQDDPHTGDEEVVPGNLGMAEHPRQSGQGIGAEAGAFEARPADGVGYQDGGHTKSEPGSLNGGHALTRAVLANSLIDGVDKGADKGQRLANNHRIPQSIMWFEYLWGLIDNFTLTGHLRTSYNGSKVAGRTVYRRWMGQWLYLELGRPTQLPQCPTKRQEQKT
jgi:hypothetical protein